MTVRRLCSFSSRPLGAQSALSVDRRSSFTDFRSGLDSQYSGPLEVGTPARPSDCLRAALTLTEALPVLFDLGSAAIYVPTASCRTVLCSNQLKFNPEASSTFVNTSQRAASLYQQGGALGYIIRETVGLGPFSTSNFTVRRAEAHQADARRCSRPST